MFFLFFIFYLELVFNTIMGGSYNVEHIMCMFLFSVAYAGVIYIATSVWPSDKVRHIVKAITLFVVPLFYQIPFFIYLQFGVFYDLNTMLGGAGDALGGFAGDIIKLLTSSTGIIMMLLTEGPFILYILYVLVYKRFLRPLIVKSGVNPHRYLSFKRALKIAEVSLISYIVGIMLVYGSDYLKSSYTNEYSYEKAIGNFGVASAYGLEIKQYFAGQTDFTEFNMNDVYLVSDFAYISEEKEDMPALVSAGINKIFEVATIDISSIATLSGNAVSGNTISANTLSGNGVSSNLVSGNSIGEQKLLSFFKDSDATHQISYGKNVQNIDFTKLSEGASAELIGLDNYVASIPGTSKNRFTGLFKGKNLIFISAEAFTAEAIDEERTPTLYRLATKGFNFTNYYQPASAGTTGGEYSNIMGMLPSAGGKSMKNTADHLNYMTIGNQLNMLGYYGMAYHNNDYTYYDRDKTHINLGYSEGYMGYGNGIEEYVKAQWPESDLEMIEGTLPTYIDKQPFNIYYMSVSGHSLYDRGCNAMSKKHWDTVENLDCSDRVKGYYACQVELDAALEYLVDELEKKGIADDTVIAISADHYPYGLDSEGAGSGYPYLTELYGTPITNNFVRDHNRLIIWSGCLEKYEPVIIDDPVFSPDLLPTLLNLFGTDYDSRMLPGRDVFSDAIPLVYDLGYNWMTDLGTYTGGHFTPASPDVEVSDDYVKTVKNMVANKINFSKGVLNYDYYRHVYGNN